jgi:toxin CptA
MPHSIRSSSAFAPCLPEATVVRLEWRPSRCLAVMLVLLGLFAACAVLACEMPRWCAVPLALVSMLRGAWLARAYGRRPRHTLAWPTEGELLVDDRRVEAVHLNWRGPLAFLAWADEQGHRQRLAWWPDTLSRAARRELRLAAAAAPNAAPIASMAP